MMNIVFWHWWVIAIVLVILEAFVSGTFLLWMGVSAAVVGLALFIFPGMGWEYQVLLFAVFSVVSIALWLIRPLAVRPVHLPPVHEHSLPWRKTVRLRALLVSHRWPVLA